jgi:hypothetical protein
VLFRILETLILVAAMIAPALTFKSDAIWTGAGAVIVVAGSFIAALILISLLARAFGVRRDF